MGVKTSSQFFKKDQDVGVVHTGLKIERPIGKDATLVFRFPVPMTGNSSTILFLGEDINPTKIKLEDGKFIIPSDWDDADRTIYRNALLKAGFTMTDYVDRSISKADIVKRYAYFAKHPDHTDSNPIEGIFKFTLNKIKRELEMVEGTIRTEDKEEYDRLLEKGFYKAREPEEVEE